MSSDNNPQSEIANEKSEKKGKGRTRTFIIIGVALVLLCCGFAVIGSFLSDSSEGESDLSEVATEPEVSEIDTEDEEGSGSVVDTPAPTHTIAPTDTPAPTNTPEPDGSSRDLAIPPGEIGQSRDFTLRVIDIERPADDTIQQGNQFNSEAEPGNEFLLVNLEVQCTLDSSETCMFTPSLDFEVFGSSGIIREVEIFIVGVPNMLEQSEFFGGATVSGRLAFEIGQDETDLILKFEPGFGFAAPVFLALPESTQ